LDGKIHRKESKQISGEIAETWSTTGSGTMTKVWDFPQLIERKKPRANICKNFEFKKIPHF
jgi:hypothetical protein